MVYLIQTDNVYNVLCDYNDDLVKYFLLALTDMKSITRPLQYVMRLDAHTYVFCFAILVAVFDLAFILKMRAVQSSTGEEFGETHFQTE